jgi:hypothetical protein
MPLGEFEGEVLRLLAANRNPESFVGGATVLHQGADSPRQSQDVDFFHDSVRALDEAFERDVGTLRANGYEVDVRLPHTDDFRRVSVVRGENRTKIEWVRDSSFRFFPVDPDATLGWRLNFWDAATNKVLALVGRQKIRDYLDCPFLHEHHLPLGVLAWAAAGKDPGFTPEMILNWASRGNRFDPDEVRHVKMTAPIDFVASKQRWLSAIREGLELVGMLPMEELGCFYLNRESRPVCPDPASPEFPKLTRHFGRIKGALPHIVEE